MSFESFTDNPFFRPLSFAALEAKEIEPIFKPSSDKTNFDATYDLEELLLEEAPLEARARRQKPREQLKDDATSAEIRADELHRMIERLFEPFDYTQALFDKAPSSETVASGISPATLTASPTDSTRKGQTLLAVQHPKGSRMEASHAGPSRSRSSTNSPNGSPPLPVVDFPLSNGPPRSVPKDYFEGGRKGERTPATSRSVSRNRRAISRSKKAHTGTEASSEGYPDDGLTPPLAAYTEKSGDEKDKKPSGMLGFLSRKRGRDRSPKARERGVLGKDGARVVVGP